MKKRQRIFSSFQEQKKKKMRIILSCCVLLHFTISSGVLCQTSSIVIGETIDHPIIYNRTFEIPAATSPWYKSVLRVFSHSEKPVQNVNYTFPPSYAVSQTVSKSIRCIGVESNVKCNNFKSFSRSIFFFSLPFYFSTTFRVV